ncbi:hypothetical protein M426DRAFT_74040 [Hypoxylon sp. CI-4A]|nr:hypothetical protein M426DRAFT_74040 [Hypoxylon sp. CI-4A]
MPPSRVPGPDNLYVGGQRNQLFELNITHVLSVIKYSLDKWEEAANRFKHMSIDIMDDADSDLLAYFPSAVRFIDQGLYPPANAAGSDASTKAEIPRTNDEGTSPGAVYVHCAMGISRSVSCVVAYLLYKYPHRFGAAQRRQTAKDAVQDALAWVRQGHQRAEPNEGFQRQLQLWWEMGCPIEEGGVEQHPVYQKWLYERLLQESRDVRQAPRAEEIRFEDEVEAGNESADAEAEKNNGKDIRCKKCRRTLATPKFVVPHNPTGRPDSANCAHIFIETLSWMRPALEDGALDGRLSCPNAKCGATVGRFAWQGLKCSCSEWVVPAFSLNRSRVDEVASRRSDAPGIRLPPGRNGSL